MKKLLLLSFLFLITLSGYSQSSFEKFKKLSGPKKSWVFFHVFKAKKALHISLETNRVADSIRKTNLLDGDHSGGQVDAFRHSYWMARLHQEIGKNAARSLGKRHEKENYLMYKKRRLEEGILPDECSKKMDLFNNEIGLTLTNKKDNTTKKALIQRIVNAIKKGRMRVIKKNTKGQYLTCNGNIISKKELQGKWINDKCLVPSNYQKN